MPYVQFAESYLLDCHFTMQQGVSEYFWGTKVFVHMMGRRMVLHLRTGSQLKSGDPSFPHVSPVSYSKD